MGKVLATVKHASLSRERSNFIHKSCVKLIPVQHLSFKENFGKSLISFKPKNPIASLPETFFF
jgi:hypothetical protein